MKQNSFSFLRRKRSRSKLSYKLSKWLKYSVQYTDNQHQKSFHLPLKHSPKQSPTISITYNNTVSNLACEYIKSSLTFFPTIHIQRFLSLNEKVHLREEFANQKRLKVICGFTCKKILSFLSMFDLMKKFLLEYSIAALVKKGLFICSAKALNGIDVKCDIVIVQIEVNGNAFNRKHDSALVMPCIKKGLRREEDENEVNTLETNLKPIKYQKGAC